MSDDDDVITLTGEDGQDYECQILDVFELAGKQYGLLRKLGQQETIVILELYERDGSLRFRRIEDNDEFERVVAWVEDQAREGPADSQP